MEELVTKVESVLTGMGITAKEARTGNKGQWNIAKSQDIQLMLDVWEEHEHHFFQVMSYVCSLGDEARPDFLKFLLEENHGFCETAFTVLDNNVYLKYTTEAEELSEEKILKSITRIAYYNEMFREKLN
jgi:demethoxyubiquinone hydroxylase (CLK1/Coq7/Cat5 family)